MKKSEYRLDQNDYAFDKESGVLEFINPLRVFVKLAIAEIKTDVIRNLILPEGVTDIAYRQFSGLGYLENVVLPETLTKIDKSGFEYCSVLKSITIPKAVSYIGYNAFYKTGLESVTLHTSQDIYFDMGCFLDCPKLKKIIIVDSTKSETIIVPWAPSMSPNKAFKDLKKGFDYENYFSAFSKAKLTDKLDMIGYVQDEIPNNPILNAYFQSLKFTSDLDCFSYAIETESSSIFKFLYDKDFLKFENINQLIDKSQEKGLVEITTQLLNYKAQKFDKGSDIETDFDLDEGPLTIRKFKEAWKTKIDGDFIEVQDYLGKLTELYIPSHIEGKKVRFADKVFEFDYFSANKRKDRMLMIKKITFEPEVIMEVADFAHFDELSSIQLPNTVKRINFHKDKNLVNINLPDSIEKIASFRGCEFLKVITIPPKVKVIEYCAFMDCENLRKVELPDGLQEIKTGAFGHCLNLEEINFPSSLKSIEGDNNVGGAFSGCSKLTDIHLPEGLVELGFGAFSGCMGLVKVEIPDSVQIMDQPFSGCLNLETVKLPNALTSIEKFAFGWCTHLSSISLPVTVRSIGEAAFYNCSALKSFEIPNGVRTIENQAFYGCSALQRIAISDSLKSIGSQAFFGCSSLIKMELPNNLMELGSSAFERCTSLKEVILPSRLERIEKSTFESCSALEVINFPYTISFIGEKAFSSCVKLSKVTLPPNLTQIGNEAFANTRVNLSEK